MREEDIAAVVAIERTSFSLPWSELSFTKELFKPRSIPKVAVIDDVVVGYMCIEYVMDEGHILNLAVHPDYRKRRIAAALAEDAIEELRQKACRCIYLEVRASNHAARNLYENFGFRMVGSRKSYYVDPVEDAVIMMRDI
jgi:ribosomal-protein-alanine N-acetyltransferase